MKNGKVISFWSATGRTGKTMLTVTFAESLKKYREKVVVVDFKEITPHIHKCFNIEKSDKSDIYEALINGCDITDSVKRHLQKKGGLWVFSGFGLNDFAKFEEEHFTAIINCLSREFDVVLLDTHGGIVFSSVYSALKNSDIIFLVTLQDNINVEDNVDLMKFVCEQWDIDPHKFNVIVNKTAGEGKKMEVSVIQQIFKNCVYSVRCDKKHYSRDIGVIVESLFASKANSFIKIGEVTSIGIN